MAQWLTLKEGEGRGKRLKPRTKPKASPRRAVIDATRMLLRQGRPTRCPWRKLMQAIANFKLPERLLRVWEFMIDEFPEVLGTCSGTATATSTSTRCGSKAFHCRPWLKGALYSAAAFAATAGAQAVLGNPTGSRFLYLLPIWFATRLSGRGLGFVNVLAVSLIMAATDATDAHPMAFFEPNGLLRLASLTALMLIISQVEGRLHTIQESARRDPLTQVLNKVEIEHRAAEAIRLWQRRKVPVSIVMIDCDRFKSINDRYGHAYGDHVLQFLARRLQSAAKGHGILGRVGGDEFLAVYQGLNPSAIRRRLNSAAHTFEKYISGMDLDASISFGIVEIGPGMDSLERALSSADKEMYSHKHGGRLAARPNGAYLTA